MMEHWEEMRARIVAEVAPERIVLFGSHARRCRSRSGCGSAGDHP